MSEFDEGMAMSFDHELRIMGEQVSTSVGTAQAVVDAVEGTQGLAGALISEDVSFDVYILRTEKERLGIDYEGKVKLDGADRMGFEGRVKSILPIEGGQCKIRITSKNQ